MISGKETLKKKKTELIWASLITQLVKNPPAMQETWEDPLEKGKATHSVFRPEEFHGLQSMGSQRVRHDCTNFTLN